MARKYTPEELDSIDEQYRAMFESQEFTFLIAESSVAIRKTMANCLTGAGVEHILEAKDGKEAQKLFDRSDSKLIVILDLNLSKIDGLKVFQYIRDHMDESQVKVVLTATEVKKEVLLAASKLKASGFLKKPITPEAFTDKMKEFGLL